MSVVEMKHVMTVIAAFQESVVDGVSWTAIAAMTSAIVSRDIHIICASRRTMNFHLKI
jgi:hypothetical protein